MFTRLGWHAQAVLGVALLAWRKPEALRPSSIAGAVTAPGRAAVGWVQETLVPPGPALPAEDARSLVLEWQAAKAQALGEPFCLLHCRWVLLLEAIQEMIIMDARGEAVVFIGPGSRSQAVISALSYHHCFLQERSMMWHLWTAFWETACCRHGGCAGTLCRRMAGMCPPCIPHGHALGPQRCRHAPACIQELAVVRLSTQLKTVMLCRHWQYDLKHVSIDRVDTSRDGRRALVEATLTEAGSLLASDGAVIDAYQATFTQEYELRQMWGKGWRLVASKLIF